MGIDAWAGPPSDAWLNHEEGTRDGWRTLRYPDQGVRDEDHPAWRATRLGRRRGRPGRRGPRAGVGGGRAQAQDLQGWLLGLQPAGEDRLREGLQGVRQQL